MYLADVADCYVRACIIIGNTEGIPSCLHHLLSWTSSSKGVCSCLCRLAGSAAFRNQLLAGHGIVVTIPYNPDSSTAKSMAEDIKAAVEAKTGLPLDSFRS